MFELSIFIIQKKTVQNVLVASWRVMYDFCFLWSVLRYVEERFRFVHHLEAQHNLSSYNSISDVTIRLFTLFLNQEKIVWFVFESPKIVFEDVFSD